MPKTGSWSYRFIITANKIHPLHWTITAKGLNTVLNYLHFIKIQNRMESIKKMRADELSHSVKKRNGYRHSDHNNTYLHTQT